MQPEIDALTGAAVLYVRSRKHGTFRVLIDPEDWPRVSAHSWHASKRRHGVYFMTDVYRDGKHTGIQLHRLVMNAPPGMEVDHRNHDYCDNRKSELRLATRTQNEVNKRKLPSQSSQFKGVSRYRDAWQASVRANGKSKHLGYCPGTPQGEIDCAKRYDAAARELHGDFALLNFPVTEAA